jgi:hypothetical protein
MNKSAHLLLTVAVSLTTTLAGCTTEQANNWAAAAAVSAKAGWDAGTQVAEARQEQYALQTARIQALQQQFQPSSAVIMSPMDRTVPYASQNLAPSYIYFQ